MVKSIEERGWGGGSCGGVGYQNVTPAYQLCS